jgi:diguanylate cyclase (GGDEF)-like protein
MPLGSPKQASGRINAARGLAGGVAFFSSIFACCALAVEPQSASKLLEKADAIKTADYAEFASILTSLKADASRLSPAQRRHLRYLEGWQSAYNGDYTSALPALTSIANEPGDLPLQFRARAAAANVLAVSTQYEGAFVELGKMIEMLPDVADGAAREQGLAVAAYLYNQVGEYDLGLDYARMLEQENWNGRGACRGAQLKLEALYKSAKLRTVGQEFQSGLDACAESGEVLYANVIRTFMARLHIDQKRFDDAIKMLNDHYEELRQTRYSRLISEFDSLLAVAYRETGNAELVRKYAQRAIDNGVRGQYTEPLVTAYRLLYVLAKEQADARAALVYHEQYAAADKGYLDDVTARQLAYQRVNHATVADKLRIDTLHKENEVLQLQRALDKKAVETSGLYITLLIIVLLSIALWAYRTKRSQLHFMRLSQVDGLTGIANRPRFIELAESALEAGTKSTQEVCVVLCDLDHFKSINDKHGHAAGDFVLKQTVAACQLHLRGSDVFGRFGGEEFGIVLPGCNLHDARLRAEQLRLAIAAISSSYDGVELTVSASFGVASTASSSYELRQLLADADAALYRAKHAGRDCVVLHEFTTARRPLAGEPAARWQAGGGDAAGERT